MTKRNRNFIPAFPAILGAAFLVSACSGGAGSKAPSGETKSAAATAGEKYASGLAHAIDKGKEERARGDLNAATRALEQYSIDHSAYPSALSCEALAAALHQARTGSVPIRDPWGNAYECSSSENGYRIASAGDDGEPGTADDITISGGSPGGP